MSEWRRTTSVLPDQGENVLIYYDRRVIAGQYWVHEPGVHEGDSGFIDVDDNEAFPVTHWMPMPKGPDHE